MRCFPLLKSILDEIWKELPFPSEDEKIDAIRLKEANLKERYRNLLSTGKASIDYSDPATRYAYICCYVTSHANLVAKLINDTALKSLFDRERVQAACIRGGPGSDLLGVLKYCEKLTARPQLKFYLYDREQAWSDSWSDVESKVGGTISTTFQSFDVTDINTLKQNTKYLKSDLFTMVYFASEVHAVRDQAAPFFENLFTNANAGAMFLYVDNASPDFFRWFDDQYENRGITVVESSDGTQLQLPIAEQKTDLGEHLNRIEGQPKLRANIAYRVLRKD